MCVVVLVCACGAHWEIIVCSDLGSERTILNRAMMISRKSTGPESKRDKNLNDERRDGETGRERELSQGGQRGWGSTRQEREHI